MAANSSSPYPPGRGTGCFRDACAGTGSTGPTAGRPGPTDAHGASTPTRGEGPQRQKRLYGLPGSPQGLLSPIPGSRSFRPQIFEDEAPGRAATREEVAAKAISIPSDASSAFRAKQTLWSVVSFVSE